MVKLLVALTLLWASVSYAAEFVPIVHSTAYESSHLVTTDRTKALYWISITWKTAATRWLIVYDSVTVPADGALTASKILYCGVVSLVTDGAVGTKSFDWTNHPLQHGSTKGIPTSAVGLMAIISVDPGGCVDKAADGDNDWFTAGFN